MKAQRVYIDTSVLGVCFDSEFTPWSNALIADFRAGRLKPVISDDDLLAARGGKR